MKTQILNLVQQTIKAKLFNKQIPSKCELLKKYPHFANKKATFITLKINGILRGCIGSLIAHRELYDDLVSNSLNAAFKDPRFPPLSKEEYKKIDIEVSILSDPIMVKYTNIKDLQSKIHVGIDGVILKQDHKQATFLPQVWQELEDFDSFFEHLCTKAGLEKNCLKLHPQIYTYQVQKIK